MKYRKKPVVIDAVQFKAADQTTHEHVNYGTPDPDMAPNLVEKYWITTLEGPLMVSEGDWIITGIKGEHYPCKPDIFEATYDTVEG